MSDAYKTFPELSKKQKKYWVADELLNFSKKKTDAWLLLCGVGKSDEIFSGVYVQLKQRSVPGLQSSVAMVITH